MLGSPLHDRICRSRQGFTLVEVLVSVAVLSLLFAMVIQAVGLTSRTIRQGISQVESFQQSRSAFGSITRRLSQATLNTYWDYYDEAGNVRTSANAETFQPNRYGRASDLHFLIDDNAPYGQALYFQAPESISTYTNYNTTQGLLNAYGMYVEFGSDAPRRPGHLPADNEYRYRLMQVIEPTENFGVYGSTGSQWTDTIKTQDAWPIARNVIALILWPRLPQVEDADGTSLTTDFNYDSRGDIDSVQYAQLPPVLQVTMVVIDEESAIRLENGNEEPALIKNALQNKFSDVTSYESDLAELKQELTDANIGFRVYQQTVHLKGSKWSKS